MQRTFFSLFVVLCVAGFLLGCSNRSGVITLPTDIEADRLALKILKKMTLDEKIQLVHGVGAGASPLNGAGFIPGIKRLGIPDLNMADSSTSVRVANVGATILPSPLALAASWDTDLAREYGELIGKELRILGFVVGLGGGVNLTREPRNGRTFEYMGEDPVLAGSLLARRTIGMQQQKIIATIKHFALNNQETNRFKSNSIVDERTMRELYLLGFEIAIKDGNPGNVMCAYNLVNGIKSCENSYLLKTILKEEWGFNGYVQADWAFAISDTVRAANAGLDEEEPGSNDDNVVIGGVPTYFNQKLKAAIHSNKVAIARLDNMVMRKLRTLFKLGIMDAPPKSGGAIDRIRGAAVAKKIAVGSIVLLKNDAPLETATAVLPFDANAIKTIVVIGGHADLGVMSGGGSGGPFAVVDNPVTCLLPEKMYTECAPYSKSSPLKAIRAKAPKARVTYFDGKNTSSAVNAAANADVAIIFATQFTGEDRDLISLSLPNQDTDPANQSFDQNALIEAVAKENTRTVVVLEHGTAVTMPWLSGVPGVIAAWYPGDKGGEVIADVLFGDVNPSGKLPLTFPKSESDLPQRAISNTDLDVNYIEGLMMGYRWYDAKRISPLFAFGHGLSYSNFIYSGMRTTADSTGNLRIHFNIKNVSNRAGAEVMQVYTALPILAREPPQRLVGWEKIQLSAGESKQIVINVKEKRLQIWSIEQHKWLVPRGKYDFYVGNSSRDVNSLHSVIEF
ncbi:MAG: beta-glucosidase [Glaciimonas sp.]|nr:beta-glucosidase [Glaciimonas sp.]